jgi:hypothetical protein
MQIVGSANFFWIRFSIVQNSSTKIPNGDYFKICERRGALHGQVRTARDARELRLCARAYHRGKCIE